MIQSPLDTAGCVAEDASGLLFQWLTARLSKEQSSWLSLQLEKTLHSNSDRDLYITLGLIPRKLPRVSLDLTDAELAQAQRCCTGWTPTHWCITTSARVAVLCAIAANSSARFDDLIVDLFRNADLAESIAYYSGIALYPRSEKLDWQIGEGLRSNIRAVFEAIAHHNPYPSMHFDENRWNHMVLKALFIESSLAPVYGLDQSANKELALILSDYAHERWAAGRPVSPELWRCVGRFASGDVIADLKRVIDSDDTLTRRSGALALSQSSDAAAVAVLDDYPDLVAVISTGELTWDTVRDLPEFLAA